MDDDVYTGSSSEKQKDTSVRMGHQTQEYNLHLSDVWRNWRDGHDVLNRELPRELKST
jgi:hypothetical protein